MKFDEEFSATTAPAVRRAVFAERLLLEFADAVSVEAAAAAFAQTLTTVGGAAYAEVALDAEHGPPTLVLARSGRHDPGGRFTSYREGATTLSVEEPELPDLALNRAVAALDRTIRRLRQRDVLLEQARTDELTGLLNRRALHERLAAELSRRDREGGACSLLLLDLDDFKLVNDVLGHAAGDAALRVVADVLQQVGRTADVSGRLGGDEFAVLLPGTDEFGARAAARRAVDGVRRAGAGVTASIGVATVAGPPSATPSTAAELLRVADSALYEAKARGRDRYVAAQAVTA